jgi:hypothetical protein
MEVSALSFLKTEWKVSDPVSVHWFIWLSWNFTGRSLGTCRSLFSALNVQNGHCYHCNYESANTFFSVILSKKCLLNYEFQNIEYHSHQLSLFGRLCSGKTRWNLIVLVLTRIPSFVEPSKEQNQSRCAPFNLQYMISNKIFSKLINLYRVVKTLHL